ncbi:MAG: TonB-dependent receptor [Bacteroidales bacterium]|jgi:hypothetical protein|nr:TonB-dependent receptor [Bacteroidales bacterium]
MKQKFITILLAILTFTTSNIFAQQTNIKGKVFDSGDETPIAFANIALSRQDSSFVTGTTSNLDGVFEIKEITQGNYILTLSYIGYETKCISITANEVEDTIRILLNQSAINLDEITIQASAVIQKEDRKIILPTQEQIKMASDGTDVIRKMQLPRIMVDPTSGEISMSGNGNIQLRINGVLATSGEIASIPPADILRIEYHDDPGARYGNADAVIDYITRRKESGININGVAFNGIGNKRLSADNRLSIKYNYGKSEFSANAMFVQRKQNWTREYDEKLIFPDNEIHRLEIGEPTLFNKKVFSTNLNYSLQEKDKYFFNAQFRFTCNDFPNGFEDRKSKLYLSNSDTVLSIFDHTKEKTNSPAIDLYFQRNLKNNQQLIFNAVGTYISTNSTRVYHEKEDNMFETDILSIIDGEKYSIIAEGIYEKKFGPAKLTSGIKHLESNTSNQYRGTTVDDISMRQSESSIFAEFQGKIKKFGYMLNLTGVRLYYTQNDIKTEKYALQPSARLTFEPNENLYFRYRINLRNNPPSLSAMNNVEQAVDSWVVIRGNQNLKPYPTLNQNFTVGYNKGIFSVDFLLTYDYEFNPIMESVFYEDGKFIRTYENQKSFQNISSEISFKFKIWKNHLNLSVAPRINHYISTGNEYEHTYTMSELRVNLDFTYKNWLANFTTITPPRFMYGEQMTKSDQMYTIMAGYKLSDWTFMIGVMNPFTKEYTTENKSWSALNPVDSKIHTDHNKSFLVKISFNLNYGKQYRSERKQLNNTDTDSGIMQGVKK